MPYHGSDASDEQVQSGTNAALKGAANGAARWGIPCLIAGAVAYTLSPVYRNLTFQFKVYLQMSGMSVGALLEGESRLREHERLTRRLQKVKRDQEAWRIFEDDYANNERGQNDRK